MAVRPIPAISLVTSTPPTDPAPASGLAAVRHRTACLARWLRLPGAAATPDCLSIRYWHRPEHAALTPRSERIPVLLVHGYAGTEFMWHPLRTALSTAGFDQVVALRYNAFRADIHQIADWLVDQAERTMMACGTRQIHLIGHSMGGLIIRDAVQARGLGNRARTVVTLATPHHGTPYARLVPGPCARQMHPGSSFLRGLTAHDRGGPTRWVDIRATEDRVVTAGPDEKAPGRADLVQVSHRAGHRSITRHPEVVARVVHELTRTDDAATARRTAHDFGLAA
jgi:triacylglycerol lipase